MHLRFKGVFVTYFFDLDNRLVRFVGEPSSSFLDRAQSIVEMVSDDNMPETATVLINVSQVTEPPTIEQLEKIWLLVGLIQLRFKHKVAIVNCAVGHQTLSQIAAALAQNDDCRAFVDEHDAIMWLNDGQ